MLCVCVWVYVCLCVCGGVCVSECVWVCVGVGGCYVLYRCVQEEIYKECSYGYRPHTEIRNTS